jgi:hypothetical protein
MSTIPARADFDRKGTGTTRGKTDDREDNSDPGAADIGWEQPLSTMMVFQETLRIWNRRVQIPISTLVLSAILVLGIFVAFFFGTRGPYIKPVLSPEIPATTGIRVIDTETVNGIVSNAAAGPLFVLKGKIVNESPFTWSHIHVTGTLFTKQGFSKVETVYCGNMLSDQELAILDLESIRTRLSNRNGTVVSNVHVETGRELPFMIVFSDLPEDLEILERFSVDIAGAYP